MGIMALSFTAYLFADPSPILPNLGKFFEGSGLFYDLVNWFLGTRKRDGGCFRISPRPVF